MIRLTSPPSLLFNSVVYHFACRLFLIRESHIICTLFFVSLDRGFRDRENGKNGDLKNHHVLHRLLLSNSRVCMCVAVCACVSMCVFTYQKLTNPDLAPADCKVCHCPWGMWVSGSTAKRTPPPSPSPLVPGGIVSENVTNKSISHGPHQVRVWE